MTMMGKIFCLMGVIAAVTLFSAESPPVPLCSVTVSEAASPERGAAASRSRGAALQPGDCIGIVAPASCMDREDFAAGIEELKGLGYRLKIGRSCRAMYGYFAGSDDLRAADINRFFLDDEVKAIICMRGGYGAARILDKLDYEGIARHPKQFMGFSDITVLHVALGEKSHLSTIHGPMVTTFVDGLEPECYTTESMARGLQGTLYPGEIPLPEGRELETVFPGTAEGVIIGGNLSVLASLVGTPYELKGDGALLFLEDVGDYTYRVDRLFQQLWMSGLLNRVNGILIGDFFGADDDYEEGDFLLDEVLAHYAELSGKPMLKGVPAGHGYNNLYLPFGVHAVMRASEDGTASLKIDEAPLTGSRAER